MKKIYYTNTTEGLVQMSKEAEFRTFELLIDSTGYSLNKLTSKTENTFTFYRQWKKGIIMKCTLLFSNPCEFIEMNECTDCGRFHTGPKNLCLECLYEEDKRICKFCNVGIREPESKICESCMEIVNDQVIFEDEVEQDLKDYLFFLTGKNRKDTKRN